MATVTKSFKTWKVGIHTIIKKRDEDGDVSYSVVEPGRAWADTFDTMADAREHIRDQQNNETLDEVHNLLGELDLSDKETTKKLAAILAYLKK